MELLTSLSGTEQRAIVAFATSLLGFLLGAMLYHEAQYQWQLRYGNQSVGMILRKWLGGRRGA